MINFKHLKNLDFYFSKSVHEKSLLFLLKLQHRLKHKFSINVNPEIEIKIRAEIMNLFYFIWSRKFKWSEDYLTKNE